MRQAAAEAAVREAQERDAKLAAAVEAVREGAAAAQAPTSALMSLLARIKAELQTRTRQRSQLGNLCTATLVAPPPARCRVPCSTFLMGASTLTTPLTFKSS